MNGSEASARRAQRNGPIFWLLNAEIYPLGVRSKAAGLGTMANWPSTSSSR
jgi:hypothetical protein